MPQNFIEGGREHGFLLPPDVREWLSADHLAWFVIDAVAPMDLLALYAAYHLVAVQRSPQQPIGARGHRGVDSRLSPTTTSIGARSQAALEVIDRKLERALGSRHRVAPPASAPRPPAQVIRAGHQSDRRTRW